MLTTDAQLARLEPTLFQDVLFLSQRLIKGAGSVDGNTLTLNSFDTHFDDAQVEPGMIVLIDSIAHEVIAKLTATTAHVSRIRADDDAPPLTPAPVFGVEIVLSTFRPQIAAASQSILRSLGLDPAEVQPPLLTDRAPLQRYAAITTLAALYSSASELTPTGPLARRAERYRLLAELERGAAAAPLDNNATRRATVVPLLRE